MLRLLRLPFKLVSLIISCVVLMLLIGALMYLQPWVRFYIPEQVQGFSGYTTSVTTCMVGKAWGDLDPTTREQLQHNPDVGTLPTSELKKISSHLSECK